MKHLLVCIVVMGSLEIGSVTAQDSTEETTPPIDNVSTPIPQEEIVLPPEPVEIVSNDTKAYSGSTCQPRLASDSRVVQIDSVGLFNTSGWKTIKISCPVLRDSASSEELPIRAAQVRISNPGDGTLQCTLISRGPFGVIPMRSMWKSDWVDFPADTVLDVTIGATLPHAIFSIDCTLPPKARIYGYEITEAPEA